MSPTTAKFTVFEPPRGWARARSGGGNWWVDAETKAKKQALALGFRLKYAHIASHPPDVPIRLSVIAFFSPPKSWAKFMLTALEQDPTGPFSFMAVKPDSDNVLKLATDALEGAAYVNDSRIFHSECGEYYTPWRPRYEITINYFEPPPKTLAEYRRAQQ